ncbi:MAG TPA: hypothetical protein VKG20_20345 [Methylomirabilota bacterium]|nr:hypothetical protein [Methylomirabilota bacterium]
MSTAKLAMLMAGAILTRRKANVAGQPQAGTNCHLSDKFRLAGDRRARRLHARRPTGRRRAAGTRVK